MTVRSLQRLIRYYIGVSPNWLIRRYRLKEAAAKIECGDHTSTKWANLALELGYFDQSHLIRDFTCIVGVSPAAYQRTLAKNRTAE